MNPADMSRAYAPEAWIKPMKGGLFEYCEEGHGTHVCQWPIEDQTTVWDVVAWKPGEPGKWRRLTGDGACLGDIELALAEREGRPARLLATPQAWIDAERNGFVILDWEVDLPWYLGIDPVIECENNALRNKFEAAWMDCASDRVRKFTVRR